MHRAHVAGFGSVHDDQHLLPSACIVHRGHQPPTHGELLEPGIWQRLAEEFPGGVYAPQARQRLAELGAPVPAREP